MSKRQVMISLDENVHDKARERGINISAVCEDTLKQVVGSFEGNKLPENCKHNWTLPFTASFGLARECKKCGAIKKVYIESYEVTINRINKSNKNK